MSDLITVEVRDPDAAIEEALDPQRGATRAQFLRRAVFGGGTLAVSGVVFSGLPELALGASASDDVKILNFALGLEYLEATFYTEAEKSRFSGEVGEFARVVAAHERAHVAYLKKALGSKANRSPKFDFRDTTTNEAKFVATSIALEDLGVSAYNGQGPNVTKKTLAAAAKIVSVEARHASWIRYIAIKRGGSSSTSHLPAPSAFDKPRTKSQVQTKVNQTHFVK